MRLGLGGKGGLRQGCRRVEGGIVKRGGNCCICLFLDYLAISDGEAVLLTAGVLMSRHECK